MEKTTGEKTMNSVTKEPVVEETAVMSPHTAPVDPSAHAGSVAIESNRAIAEAQAALIMAKQFPRNRAEAVQRILDSCKQKTLADDAFYSYRRGGQLVTGPSIRLAEEIARCYGNIEFGTKELSQTAGKSEMQAFAWDTETNVKSSQNFTVAHIRETRQGDKHLTGQRDIYELTANMAARRLRARILAIIPPDIVNQAVDACKLTLAGDNTESIADRVNKIVAAFAEYGVQVSHLEAFLSCPLDKVTIDHIVTLKGAYKSIRDGLSSASDFFGTGEGGPQSPAAANLTAKLKASTPEEAKEEPADQPADADPDESGGADSETTL